MLGTQLAALEAATAHAIALLIVRGAVVEDHDPVTAINAVGVLGIGPSYVPVTVLEENFIIPRIRSTHLLWFIQYIVFTASSHSSKHL